ncbi:hypothetical protein FKN04_12665 [Bacillus glycinifermentans]|uniref:hypothetical protein n=1 Tax=Bacillus glycinifermentans TaxID=1664069 RepID=UPI001582DEF5|nr:hypothetical protein [Bacillus glycinifermentans]NUJ17428.1 hypothetical protein [Bacillus glycinifermentans]
MNYFIYFVSGALARNYLKETNYVGVWADTQSQAVEKVKEYFPLGTPIIPVTKNQIQGRIGYLY